MKPPKRYWWPRRYRDYVFCGEYAVCIHKGWVWGRYLSRGKPTVKARD